MSFVPQVVIPTTFTNELMPLLLQGGKPNPLAKRLKGILSKIDKQLEAYDNEVGGRLNMFETDNEGKIAVKDLKSALEVIRHRFVLFFLVLIRVGNAH